MLANEQREGSLTRPIREYEGFTLLCQRERVEKSFPVVAVAVANMPVPVVRSRRGERKGKVKKGNANFKSTSGCYSLSLLARWLRFQIHTIESGGNRRLGDGFR